MKEKTTAPYKGFEQGPIRPPSEAESLLLRITRNCPWNHCTFCGLYKDRKFSLRPVSHILSDIDSVRSHVAAIEELMSRVSEVSHGDLKQLAAGLDSGEQMAFSAALRWVRGGKKSIFLQDSNSLIIKPDDLVTILKHVRDAFPGVERITSYARSHTIARIGDDDLARMAAAGLNRIHIGMESSSDAVLTRIKKGTDKETQVLAGRKVKGAGIQLSEYFMPGLGGKALSREHALETAEALNRIDADFIRLRTLGVPESVALFEEVSNGSFEQMGDREVAEELLLFLETLSGIGSTIRSDHILNLFPEVDGRLPEDKDKMTGIIRRFLAMPRQEQMLYQVGRRIGYFTSLDDVADAGKRQYAEQICAEHGITTENVDNFAHEMMKRFI